MARSKSILYGTSAIIVAITAVVIGLRSNRLETQNSGATDEPRHQSASSRVRHRLTSSEARDNLSAVLSGRRKAPDMSDSKSAARMQYYNDTTQWIAALSLADCVMLIDGIESDDEEYDLIYKLYIRHGELDPKGALQRIGGDPPDIWREPVKLDKLRSVLRGWARVDPKSAWDYFERWRLEDGLNLIRTSGSTGDVAYEVFCAWVNQDSKTAFTNLLNVHPIELERAGQGYYWNLPKDSDFPAEARNLEHLIDYKKQREELWLTTKKDESIYWWRLSLCTKWANRDPDSASEWWLNMNDYLKRDGSKTAEEQQEVNADWLGLLIANWAGKWHEADGENNADAAVGWILDNPKWFRERNFRNRVLPSIARHRPMDALRLIKQIETSEERSYQLWGLVQAPSYQNPSRILDPDTVESELSTFQLANEDLRRVQKAVAERREYEANLPPPQPSVW